MLQRELVDVPAHTNKKVFSALEFSLGTPLVYGSACTGLGTEHWAAARGHPLRPHFVAFACDNSADSTAWLLANGRQLQHIADIMSQEFKDAPVVQIFVCGFPCQPFSSIGTHAGVEHEKAGNVWYYVFTYLKDKQPRIAILENVEGLITHHPQTFRMIFQMIKDIVDRRTGEACYSIHWDILDSLKVGCVPQRRRRLYIILLRRCGRSHVPFTWPKPIPPPPLSAVLEGTALRSYHNYPIPCGKTVRRNVEAALRKTQRLADARGVRAESIPVVVDVGGTALNLGEDHTPCLTKTRGQTRAFFNLNSGTFLGATEMFRLQGHTDDEIMSMKMVVSENKLGALLGNAMTKTVLQRLIAASISAYEGHC